MKYKEVDYQMNRRNYRQADNINYLDGDRNSNLRQEEWTANSANVTSGDDEEGEEGEESEGSDYEEGEGEEEGEESVDTEDANTNKMYRRVATDKDHPTVTLVNNKVRVVKGGSWKDRAYYLQASTRRYYDQDKSASWIGFRCAMDRLGSRVQ